LKIAAATTRALITAPSTVCETRVGKMAAISQAQCVVNVTAAAPAARSRVALRASFSGKSVAAKPAYFAAKRQSVLVRAEEKTAEKAVEKKEEAPWSPPKLNPNTPSPIFGGSTGGLLRKAQVEEFYVLTWEAPKEMIFEMPVRVRASRRRVFLRARRRRVARGRRRRRRSARVVVRSILDRTRRRSRVRIIARSARVPTTRRRSLAGESASEKTTPRRRNPRCPRNPRAIAAPFEARRPSPLTF